ncbi:hypothetical protein [Scytonema sp. NUACC26]|uniref:hypothetical protein n=1 Tax=Scytonema sp. NUACC26 TaxID=3140176 RepID=UPI0034DC5D44
MGIDCKWYISFSDEYIDDVYSIPDIRTIGWELRRLIDDVDWRVRDEQLVSEEKFSWYNLDIAIDELGKLFPNVLFIIDYVDEEGDRGRVYAKDRLYYEVEPEIVFPNFNESLLTNMEEKMNPPNCITLEQIKEMEKQ